MTLKSEIAEALKNAEYLPDGNYGSKGIPHERYETRLDRKADAVLSVIHPHIAKMVEALEYIAGQIPDSLEQDGRVAGNSYEIATARQALATLPEAWSGK